MTPPRSILVVHPWMGRGGSEATALWTLQALQGECERLAFATSSIPDWDDLNAAYGSRVDRSRIETIRVPHLPFIDGPERFARLHRRHFERGCRRLAAEFDLCVSAYNPIDFGRPSIQLIGDFSFSEEMRKRLYVHGEERLLHRKSLVRRLYLKTAELAGAPERPLRERGDLVLANSRWSAAQLERYFDLPDAPVIYPPVSLPGGTGGMERDPLGFACLGRIAPEKEIERIVRILEKVRDLGHPVKLHVIGDPGGSAYGRRIDEMLRARESWIVREGFLGAEAKQRVLAGRSFALHACRIEAFGIAVAEMAAMGCIPFVPSTGGAGEIVPLPELQFGEDEEAVEKIVRLLESPAEAEAIRARLPEEVRRFGPEKFVQELRDFVIRFLHGKSGHHPDAQKNAISLG